MAKRKGPSARDLAEIRSGKASARDRREAGLGKRATSGKRRRHMSTTPRRKRGK